MRSMLSFFIMAVLISAGPSASANSDKAAPFFTLQVASFPEAAQAGRFAVGLVSAGETPVLETVEIEGRGFWTRVFVGLFAAADAADRYGATLVARGIIKEFLVKRTGPSLALTRPRRIGSRDSQVPNHTSGLSNKSSSALPNAATGSGSSPNGRPASGMPAAATPVNNELGASKEVVRDHIGAPLPVVQPIVYRLAPSVDTNLIPRPDPVDIAFKLVAGEARSGAGSAGPRGGLWLSGDTAEGLARLRWIAGEENIGLIKLDADGRVTLDMFLLAKAAGLRETSVEDPLRAVDYISSNEGLLLLVQVAKGRYRYLLHVGRQAPTSGNNVEAAGSINLDNNLDSRINPYRRNGKKLDAERPPKGFDSLIGLNPVARWFNLSANCWVQAGEIVFHEIAEAHAKLEYGLDYLDHGSRAGAHSVALQRELRLRSQRPGVDIVITAGSNRLLRTEAEIRLFYAEAGAGSNQR